MPAASVPPDWSNVLEPETPTTVTVPAWRDSIGVPVSTRNVKDDKVAEPGMYH